MTTVYTIGYEGTDIDNFVAVLKKAGIQVLADVRAVAVSRKKGFSKRALQARLEAEGIGYVHLVALGDPKEGREAARAGHHARFVRVYNAHLAKDHARTALKDLAGLVTQQPTCLMCFERDPQGCHRSIVATQLECGKIETRHLYSDDQKQHVRNVAELSRRRSSQGATAA